MATLSSKTETNPQVDQATLFVDGYYLWGILEEKTRAGITIDFSRMVSLIKTKIRYEVIHLPGFHGFCVCHSWPFGFLTKDFLLSDSS